MISATIVRDCVTANRNGSASAVFPSGRKLLGTAKRDGSFVVPLMGILFIVPKGFWRQA